MVREVVAKSLFFIPFFLFSLHISRCSGTYISFSNDAIHNDHNELVRENKVIFPTSRRLLINKSSSTTHDIVAPFTIPPLNPSPAIINIPSSNPTTTVTNPTITVPYTNPTTTPITSPSTYPTNPSATPITDPTNPVTNPTTTPIMPIPPVMPDTSPVTNPTVNPVTTPITTPVTNPVTNPVTPVPGLPNTVPVSPVTGLGQGWCVAKSGVSEAVLQSGLDYACGSGLADCSSIQMSGSCYNPNSLQAHASYAFNSYYQKNPVPTSCDFGGAAMIVTTNPSTGTCIYPSSSSSSSTSSLNPPTSNTGIGSTGSTGIGIEPTAVPPPNTTYGYNSGSGSPVFSTNPSNDSNTVFGSDSPTGTISSSTNFLPGYWISILILASSVLLQYYLQ